MVVKKKDPYLTRIVEIENEFKNSKNLNNDNKDKYTQLLEKILFNTKQFWFPNKKKYSKIKSNSWFDIVQYNSDKKNDIFDAKINVPTIESIIKCEIIKIYPNELQRTLLITWMRSYNRMYNETIKLFKKTRFDKNKISLNWRNLRTKYLKNIKEKIKNESQIKHIKNNTKINGHVLDFAIQDACSKYKSCLTNLKNGNIKHFRLRYLKQNKKTLIMKIEKNFISAKKNTFCSTIFKDSFLLKRQVNKKHLLNKTDKNVNKIEFNLKDIKKDFTIHYNQKTNEFFLLNPVEDKSLKSHTNVETVGCDPGIRTFITTYSNNGCAKIANNLKDTILKHIKQIDFINNSNKPLSKKRRAIRSYYKKITYLVDDLHWKTINYLTKNFGNILIGNLSTKSIAKNGINNKLDKETKRVGLQMRLHVFKQRLAYKCTQRKIGFTIVDEAYTTKTCTNCGNKNDVGMKKRIKCLFCKIRIDRDFNGARNIFLKNIDII